MAVDLYQAVHGSITHLHANKQHANFTHYLIRAVFIVLNVGGGGVNCEHGACKLLKTGHSDEGGLYCTGGQLLVCLACGREVHGQGFLSSGGSGIPVMMDLYSLSHQAPSPEEREREANAPECDNR